MPSCTAVVKLARALGVDCTAFQDCDDVAEDGEPDKKATGKAKAAAKPIKPKK